MAKNENKTPLESPANQTPQIRSIARDNLQHLWERAARVVVPIAAVGGFVSDVLSPIAPFVTILMIVTALLCFISGVMWFGFKRRQIRRAMLDGVIDELEFKNISSVNAWSVAFAFNLVASLMLMIFFGAQKVFAQGQPDKGVMATVLPEVAHLQEQILGLQKTTERIEESTKRIETSGQRIESKTEEMRVALENIDKRVQELGENTSAQTPTEKPDCPQSKELSPYGKVFENADLVVEMAVFNANNKLGLQDALLRIRGSAAHEIGIDGRVIHYLTKPGFGGGTDFTYKSGEAEPVRMIFRSNFDGELVRVFMKDDKPYDLKLNKIKSQKLCTSELLAKPGSN